MIFEKRIDEEYHRWFAWWPIILHGPDEWDRARRLGTYPRWVWLRFVWRKRAIPDAYYVLFDSLRNY